MYHMARTIEHRHRRTAKRVERGGEFAAVRVARRAVMLVAMQSAALLSVTGRPAQAQHEHGPPAPVTATAEPTAAAAHEAMARNMTEGTHVRLSPTRAGTRADSVRALAIADTLRAAIAKYADTAVAVRDGYKLFAPKVKAQAVLHYSKWTSALAEAYRFDPAKPTSLLYGREADGGLKLIGAMYTAPKSAREGELDRRVPLSIGRWHRHVKLCLLRRGQESRLTERRNGVPQFGPEGAIDTAGECDAAGGRFFPSLFGWMIHANVFAGGDIASIWGGERHAH